MSTAAEKLTANRSRESWFLAFTQRTTDLYRAAFRTFPAETGALAEETGKLHAAGSIEEVSVASSRICIDVLGGTTCVIALMADPSTESRLFDRTQYLAPLPGTIRNRISEERADVILLRASHSGRTYADAAEMLDCCVESGEVLCLPLRDEKGLNGALLVASGSSDGPFDSRRWPLFVLLAGQLGIIIGTLKRRASSLHSLGVESVGDLVGASDEMRAVYGTIRQVASVNMPVLIVGETGTGKELTARAIHQLSDRRQGPLVVLNCAAVPSELLESELFGHEKGAFTGSVARRTGKAELAEGGTLLLDELTEMPTTMQAKLLRFLEDKTYERVGGTSVLEADVRVLAATNRDIGRAVKEGALRLDLMYRLNTFTLHLPPLRERKHDIPILVEHFLEQSREELGHAASGIDPDAYEILDSHEWPGNVRELRNTIRRAAIRAGSGRIRPEHILLSDAPGQTDAGDEKEKPPEFSQISVDAGRPMAELRDEMTERFERAHMSGLLKKYQGNVSRSAKAAGVGRKNFTVKMKKYGLDREDFIPS